MGLCYYWVLSFMWLWWDGDDGLRGMFLIRLEFRASSLMYIYYTDHAGNFARNACGDADREFRSLLYTTILPSSHEMAAGLLTSIKSLEIC